MSIHFLVSFNVAPPHLAMIETVLKAGSAFLEACGSVKCTDVGSFRRRGKGKKIELCRLVAIVVEARALTVDAEALGSTLESNMRSTMHAAAGVGQGDVRVYTGGTQEPS